MSETTKGSSAVLNPFLAQPAWRRVSSLIGIYLAALITLTDSVGYGTLLPTAIAELGGGELYALTTALGGVFSIVAMPVLAYVATRHPAARPHLFAFGMLLVAATEVIRSAAPDMSWVMVAAALKPIGATAVLYVVGLTLIRDMFEARRAATLLGLVSTMTALSMIVGAVLVGAIIDTLGWRAVGYIFTIPIVIAVILVFIGARPSKREASAIAQNIGKADILGAVLLALFIGFLIFPISLGTGLVRYGTPLNTMLLVLAGVTFILFAMRLRQKKAEAIIPTPTLRDRNTMMLFSVQFLAQASGLLILVFVPYFLLGVMRTSATEAGIAAGLYGLPGVFIGPIVGRWIAKTGSAKSVIMLSTLFKFVAMLVLGFLMITYGATLSIWAIYACMFVSGIYIGLNNPVLQAAPQLLISGKMRVQGNATTQTAVLLGPTLGAAAFGSLVVGLGLERGVPIAIFAGALAAALTAVPAMFLRRRTLEEIAADDLVGEADADDAKVSVH